MWYFSPAHIHYEDLTFNISDSPSPSQTFVHTQFLQFVSTVDFGQNLLYFHRVYVVYGETEGLLPKDIYHLVSRVVDYFVICNFIYLENGSLLVITTFAQVKVRGVPSCYLT